MNTKKAMTGWLFGAFSVMALASGAKAQMAEGIIMEVDGEQVPTSEFLYLFNKNNVQQAEPQSLDDYMGLFEAYRLKVAEAKSLGVDTTLSFRKEIDEYQRDLITGYVVDSVLMNKLVSEAIHRDSVMVESSHIMIIRTHDQEKDQRNLAILDSLRSELLNGADFIELAKNYSQDRFSSEKGGYLGFSPAGYYPYAFETAVYETPEGEISEIIESHVGWHIVKSGARKNVEEFDRSPRSYDEVKTEVERKSSSPFDTRYHLLRKKTMENLGKKHPEVDLSGLNEEEAYTALITAEEKNQYNSNPDYRNLVDEYLNGSLLYVVSVENIWDKAANDEEGLEAQYNSNKNKYLWNKPHAKGLMIQAKNDSVASVIKEGIANLPADSVAAYVKANYRKTAKAEKFNLEEGRNALIDEMVFGTNPTFEKPGTPSYILVGVKIIEAPESYQDVRSEVINDYQEVLEKNWVENLRKKHSISWNRAELDKIRKSTEVNKER